MIDGQAVGSGLRAAPFSPTEFDIAWAAGLFEGEGCWNAYVRPGGTVQMQARLGMTDRDVVERFARIAGFGRIHVRSDGRPNHKPIYDWCVYEAEKVRALVALFLPFMGERRRAQALAMLDIGADVRPANEKKKHCPHGHELSGENLLLEPIQRSGRTHYARRCRMCRRAQERQRMRRQRGITPDRFRLPD